MREDKDRHEEKYGPRPICPFCPNPVTVDDARGEIKADTCVWATCQTHRDRAMDFTTITAADFQQAMDDVRRLHHFAEKDLRGAKIGLLRLFANKMLQGSFE